MAFDTNILFGICDSFANLTPDLLELSAGTDLKYLKPENFGAWPTFAVPATWRFIFYFSSFLLLNFSYLFVYLFSYRSWWK